MAHYAILLTACINPNGMPLTIVNDANIRKQQYIDSLHFYLGKTKLPIVFVDNSNTNISNSFKNELLSNRLEILTFDGNKNKTHGKGYGELEIIEYAIANSIIILSSTIIIKITGRLKVNNIISIENQLRYYILPLKSIICRLNSDCSTADSRMFIAPKSFFNKLVNHKNEIHDIKGIYLEHVLAKQIKETKEFHYHPFLTDIRYEGISGSTGEVYIYKKNTIKYKITYFIFTASIYSKMIKQIPNIRQNIIRNCLLYVTLYICKLINFLYK